MPLLDDLRLAGNETVAAVVERLVQASAREDDRLDYKQVLNLQTDEQKLELARDVSGFANARGGSLVFGVRERRENGENTGEPEAVVALAGLNPDKVERQLLDILDAHLQPRVPGVGIRIAPVTGGHILVVNVPRSWCGPHMVKNGTFWVRQGARKRQFDVVELRASFLGSEELGVRARRFRDERLGRLIAGDTPVPLSEPEPLLVVHAIPISSLEGRFASDLVWCERNVPKLWPNRQIAEHRHSRFNIDGFLTALWDQAEKAMDYTLVFRTGAVEFVDAYVMGAGVAGCFIETRILAAARTLLDALVAQGASGPVEVLTSLLGVSGVVLANDGKTRLPWEKDRKFDRSTVLLPDVLLDDVVGGELERAMKPSLDAMWQAAGWPRSAGYGPDGAFLPERHREA